MQFSTSGYLGNPRNYIHCTHDVRTGGKFAKDKFVGGNSIFFVSFVSNKIQWNPSITDTIGNQHLVPYSEVSLTEGLLVYFRWAWYCVIGLLSTTWLRFQSFPLLYAGREG